MATIKKLVKMKELETLQDKFIQKATRSIKKQEGETLGGDQEQNLRETEQLLARPRTAQQYRELLARTDKDFHKFIRRSLGVKKGMKLKSFLSSDWYLDALAVGFTGQQIAQANRDEGGVSRSDIDAKIKEDLGKDYGVDFDIIDQTRKTRVLKQLRTYHSFTEREQERRLEKNRQAFIDMVSKKGYGKK